MNVGPYTTKVLAPFTYLHIKSVNNFGRRTLCPWDFSKYKYQIMKHSKLSVAVYLLVNLTAHFDCIGYKTLNGNMIMCYELEWK